MRRRGFLISGGIALTMTLAVAGLRGGFNAVDPASGYRAWSDAFFTSGVFVGGAGLLAFASSEGLFDILRYGTSKALRIVLSKPRRDAYPRTFHDYRLQRRGRGMSGPGAMLTGLICLLLSGLFLFLYMYAA